MIQENRTALQDPRKGQMPEKLALNVTEAAQALGVSRQTMYSLIHRTDFPSFQMGGRRLISTEGLREWVREQAKGVSA